MRFLFIGPPVSSSLPPHGRLPSRSWLRVVVESRFHDRCSYKRLAPSKQRAHAGRTPLPRTYFGLAPEKVQADVGYTEQELAIHIAVQYRVYERMVISMTRTNVVLDDELVQKCQRVTGIQTRRSVIDHALRELLRRGNQKKILALKGNVSWDGDLAAWRAGRGVQ